MVPEHTQQKHHTNSIGEKHTFADQQKYAIVSQSF